MKRTKYGDYERKVRFDVLGFCVFVVFTDDLVKSVTGRYDRIEVSPSVQAMHGRDRNSPYSHLFFRIGDCSAGTIAHESWHAVRYLLDEWTGCGITNEVVAYHLGYLVDCVSRFKNDLIDSGVGVKSTQEVSNAKNHIAQGTTSDVPRLQSRFERTGEARTEGEEVSIQEVLNGSEFGHCCP